MDNQGEGRIKLIEGVGGEVRLYGLRLEENGDASPETEFVGPGTVYVREFKNHEGIDDFEVRLSGMILKLHLGGILKYEYFQIVKNRRLYTGIATKRSESGVILVPCGVDVEPV